jgi:hypothetical protein
VEIEVPGVSCNKLEEGVVIYCYFGNPNSCDAEDVVNSSKPV